VQARIVGCGLACVLALTACGSSRLSHPRFVEKANAICADYHGRAAHVPLEHSVTGYERYAEHVLPIYQGALDQLHGLNPPGEDETLVSIWLARDRAIANDIARIGAAARARNVQKLNAAVAKARSDGRRSADLALQLGLDECAQS
jgi:hypothetical protein